MDDNTQTLLFKVFLLCAIAAFYPQILAFMRKHGYRTMKEQREWEARQNAPPDPK